MKSKSFISFDEECCENKKALAFKSSVDIVQTSYQIGIALQTNFSLGRRLEFSLRKIDFDIAVYTASIDNLYSLSLFENAQSGKHVLQKLKQFNYILIVSSPDASLSAQFIKQTTPKLSFSQNMEFEPEEMFLKTKSLFGMLVENLD